MKYYGLVRMIGKEEILLIKSSNKKELEKCKANGYEPETLKVVSL